MQTQMGRIGLGKLNVLRPGINAKDPMTGLCQMKRELARSAAGIEDIEIAIVREVAQDNLTFHTRVRIIGKSQQRLVLIFVERDPQSLRA